MIRTSGFAKAELRCAQQEHVRQVSQDCGIRLLGPNSLSFINFLRPAVGWAATPENSPSRHIGVGLVSQSGASGDNEVPSDHRRSLGAHETSVVVVTLLITLAPVAPQAAGVRHEHPRLARNLGP